MTEKNKLLFYSLLPGSLMTSLFAVLHFTLLYKLSFNPVFFPALTAYLLIWPKVFIKKYKIISSKKSMHIKSVIWGSITGTGIILLFILYFNLNRSFFIKNSAIVNQYIESSELDKYFIFFVIYTCIINPLIEEYYWRRYLYGGYRKILGPGPSVLISSLAFGLHHYIILFILFPIDFALTVGTLVVVGGAVWSLILEKYNSITGCVISHACADIAIIYIVFNMISI
jgi:uncharacterized protein